MALLGFLTTQRTLDPRVQAALGSAHSVALSRSWQGLLRLIRERPVASAVIDLPTLDVGFPLDSSIRFLREDFPHLGIVLLVHRPPDPYALFRLGRAGIRNLVLLRVEDVPSRLLPAVRSSLESGATFRVLRTVGPVLPRRERYALFTAMDSIHRKWSAEEVARAVGLSRPFLSECLKRLRLPSLGHLILWGRLFHAGLWLEEPGRTGESVSRQLEYSSGAAFRRALKHYTGATPTGVRERGGLRFVLERFFERHGLQGAPMVDRRFA